MELKFDDPAAGFFLRSVDLTAGSNAAAAAGVIVPAEAAAAAVPSSEPSVDDNDDGRPLGVRPLSTPRQFALLKSSQTVVLRAAYGPFLSSQTVTPASRLTVAEYAGGANFVNVSNDMPALLGPQQQFVANDVGNIAASAATTMPTAVPYMDLSAHLVTREVRKDQPVLRVVFHAGQSLRHGAAARKKNGGGMCIVLSGQLNVNKTVETTCTPQGKLYYVNLKNMMRIDNNYFHNIPVQFG